MVCIRHVQRLLSQLRFPPSNGKFVQETRSKICSWQSRYSSQVAHEFGTDESQLQPLLASKGTKLSFIELRSHIHMAFTSFSVSTDSYAFQTTKSGEVIVYTDGSCLSNNTTEVEVRKSGIGVYWGCDNHPLNVSMPHGGRKLTNNRAEIAAVHAAVILAKSFKIERLRLYTDSKNVVNSCKYWLPVWENNSWRLKSSDKPVKNQDMWKKLAEDLRCVLVDFNYMFGKNEGIKKAHKLAQAGANCTVTERAPLQDA